MHRLLLRFAVNIPGARQADFSDEISPETIARAAKAELDIHLVRDQDDRAQAAGRARRQLSDMEQLFGTRLTAIRGTGSAQRNPLTRTARMIDVTSTEARLDKLRGDTQPVSHNARTIAALTANPGCARRSLMDAAGVDRVGPN